MAEDFTREGVNETLHCQFCQHLPVTAVAPPSAQTMPSPCTWIPDHGEFYTDLSHFRLMGDIDRHASESSACITP